jgi:hypothetical protein
MPDGDTTTSEPTAPAEDGLGPAGEKALDAFKVRARDAERAAKAEKEAREAVEEELAALRAASQSEQEKAIDAARKEAADAAARAEREKAAEKIGELMRLRLQDRIAVAASGRFANPGVAGRLLDPDELVDDEGHPDEAKIGKALDTLLEREPYLAANGQRPPATPDPDQGPRGGGGSGSVEDRARERARKMGVRFNDDK